MLASKSTSHLAWIIALLACVASTPHVARADEADNLSGAILSHLRERLPATAVPVTPADEARVRELARSILKLSYYPTDVRKMAAAANAAMDEVDPKTATASSLMRPALAAALESIDRRARVYPYHGPIPAGNEAKPLPLPQARQVGSLWVVSMGALFAPGSNRPGKCIHDYGRYFDALPMQMTRGIVLDLRGNEGGYLPDVACLAGLFVSPGAELFELVDKHGASESVKSESSDRELLTAPMSIFIDKRTDSGGLLLAAVLQDQHRARIIGESKADINGAVSVLLRPKFLDADVTLPVGELVLPGKHPLAAGVRVDVTVPAKDEAALMNAANATLRP